MAFSLTFFKISLFYGTYNGTGKGSFIIDVTRFWLIFKPFPPSSLRILVLRLINCHHKISEPANVFLTFITVTSYSLTRHISGRLKQLMEESHMLPHSIRFLALDEADR